MDRDPDELATDVGSIPEYAALFADAFPENPRVTVENLASALATYQRTFVSKDSAYDAYVDGSSRALSEELVEGMFRFAEMGCDGCHSPPLFESNNFAHRGVADIEGVIDYRLEEATGRSEDRGRFRTPTLRNVNNTQPYFHNDSVLKPSDAVRHELEQSEHPVHRGGRAPDRAEFIAKALRDDHSRRRPSQPRCPAVCLCRSTLSAVASSIDQQPALGHEALVLDEVDAASGEASGGGQRSLALPLVETPLRMVCEQGELGRSS